MEGSNGGGVKRAAVGEGRTPKAAAEVLVDLTSDSEDELPLKRKIPQPKATPPVAEPTIIKSDDNYSSNGKQSGHVSLNTLVLYSLIYILLLGVGVI